MIDPETRQKLETNIAVRLAVIPSARFRALAAPHGGDAARHAVARDLAEAIARAFDVTPDTRPRPAPTIPAPTDGRKSWAEAPPRKE